MPMQHAVRDSSCDNRAHRKTEWYVFAMAGFKKAQSGDSVWMCRDRLQIHPRDNKKKPRPQYLPPNPSQEQIERNGNADQHVPGSRWGQVLNSAIAVAPGQECVWFDLKYKKRGRKACDSKKNRLAKKRIAQAPELSQN